MIDDVKIKARQNSVNGLMEAVNMTYTKSQLTGSSLKLPITATINNGIITATDGINNNPVEYIGEKPISGKIVMDLDGNMTAVSVKYSDNSICSMGKGENGCTQNILTLPGMVEDNGENTNADSRDNERKIFKGENPNNYIRLKENGVEQEYRIVSIESDGTIKVIRQNSLGNMPYDRRIGSEPYDGPRKNADNPYCNYDGTYFGCNAWNKVNGTNENGASAARVSDNADLNTYLNNDFYNTLDANVRRNIVTHSFNTSPNKFGALSNTLTSLKNATKTWEGKIGLLELRDWFNATSNNGCGNGESGKSWYKENEPVYECSLDNYLYLEGIRWWTISPHTSYRYPVFLLNSAGYISSDYGAYGLLGVRPVFYLTSNISLTGEGTQTNPYRIKN